MGMKLKDWALLIRVPKAVNKTFVQKNGVKAKNLIETSFEDAFRA